jgi:hypothetical protein
MRRQRGVTFIGWIFILVPIAIVLYALIRVGPEYYGYYKLVQSMKGTATHLKGEEALNPQMIRNALDLRFNTDYVDVLTGKDIEVRKEDAKWLMSADYEKEVPMFGNIALLLKFKEQVTIN